jgi:adenosine deaminase
MSVPGEEPKARSLRAELRTLPKIDLHRHLEGSLRLETLAEIAQEHGIDLPGYAIEALRPLATVTEEQPDFHRFLEKFKFLRRFYPTREAVERLAYEAVTDAANDNIKYLELRFNPVALARVQGFSLEAVTTWVCDAIEKAQRDRDIRANLIVQIGRDESLETAAELAQVALTYRDRGIVGLDLAGDEQRYPASPFNGIFRQARREGLHVTVHAGEAGDPRNIEEAITRLEAERIGHGVRSIEDSNVLRLLRDRNVALEICPTSNIQTGVVQHFWHHPLPDLLALNVQLTINTDDPSVSDTTLTDEYWVAMQAMGVSLDQIKQTIVTAAEVSFQPPEERALLAVWFRKELRLSSNEQMRPDRRAQ